MRPKKQDAPSGGYRGGDKSREAEKQPGVEPEKKEDDVEESEESGEREDRDELT